MTHTDPAPDLAAYVPGEVRAILAREGTSLGMFADRIDRHPDWVSRRLSSSRATVGITLEDLQVIADGLGIDPGQLLP